MCIFNVLFDSRLEVIGKFSVFNNYMYFRIEMVYFVGCFYNIIFGYWSIEYMGIIEFLLYFFGDIEYVFFIFIGYVLFLDKGIRIVVKFFFECFINGVYYEIFFIFDRFWKFVFIFLRNIWFGKDKVINVFWNWIGCS